MTKSRRYVGADRRITMTRTSVKSMGAKWIYSDSGYGPAVDAFENTVMERRFPQSANFHNHSNYYLSRSLLHAVLSLSNPLLANRMPGLQLMT
jgi:hypothetical protein